MNRRIIYQGHKATIKYEGPLRHEDHGDEVWLGVEWDEPSRGRHNGTVGDVVYFATTDGEKSGSLLKKEKVTLGHKLLDALFLKYFREIPPELLQESETKVEQTPESLVVTLANCKQVRVEFDNSVFFETIKKKKKMVEFYGFDEIYKKLQNLEAIQELSLECQAISNIGPYGFTAGVFKNLKILCLEDNLLYSWHQVFSLGSQLKSLKELTVSTNFLAFDYLEPTQQQVQQGPCTLGQHIFDHEQNCHLDIQIENSCNHIEVLVLINMRLKWKDVMQVLLAFRGLRQLFLCKNPLTDFENLQLGEGELQKLTHLNLESCEIKDFEQIQQSFGGLPELEHLTLNRNEIKELCQITRFKKITHLMLDHNLLNNPKFLHQLSAMPLVYLSIKHNPISERLGKLYVRQRTIAELSSLQLMNGSQITKFERKDSEIFYMKSAFEEYFILKKVKHYYYDWDDFVLFVNANHPKVHELIAKYGNPYEIDPTVKGEFNKPKQQNAAHYCSLKIIDRAGKLKGKPTEKKFLSNTGIFPVRQVVSKLANIPLKQVQVSIQVNQESEIVLMDGKDMTLDDYGAIDGSLIYVDQIE